MLKEIKTDEWAKIVNNGSFPVFFNPDYLNAISTAFELKISYYNFIEKDTLLFLASVFFENNKVIVPDNFTYNPYYLNPTISERNQIAIQKQFIELLKSKYRSITIKFNIDILDIRPYKWAGFKIDVRYTYIKNTNEPAHHSIIRNIKTVSKKDIEVLVNKPTINAINLNVDFLTTLSYTPKQKKRYFNFLVSISSKSLISNFEVYGNRKQVCSSLVLIDKLQFKGFILVLNPVSNEFKYAHTLLYQTIINWLKDNNYTYVDFCGANYGSIANFKSFFNPELKSYYVVNYKKKRFGFLNKIKVFVKQIIKKLRINTDTFKI